MIGNLDQKLKSKVTHKKCYQIFFLISKALLLPTNFLRTHIFFVCRVFEFWCVQLLWFIKHSAPHNLFSKIKKLSIFSKNFSVFIHFNPTHLQSIPCFTNATSLKISFCSSVHWLPIITVENMSNDQWLLKIQSEPSFFNRSGALKEKKK